MLIAAIVCFALAAVGGLVLAYGHITDEAPGILLALGHGLLSATGLVLLILAYLAQASALGTMGTVSLGAFVVAALGGFYLFSRRFASEGASTGVIVIHGGVAVVGFVLLLIAFLG